MMLTISPAALQKIRIHGAEAYPEECCGLLLGGEREDGKEVLDVLRMGNAREESRTRRFLIAPEEYTRGEALAAAQGMAVMGFYHSHPDHPARPSQFDLDHAWPWCSYVIAAVENRVPTAVKSWVLKEDRSGFDEEIIESREQASSPQAAAAPRLRTGGA